VDIGFVLHFVCPQAVRRNCIKKNKKRGKTMRGIISILLTLLLLTPGFSQKRSKVVSVNPVGFIFGIFGLEYQENIDVNSAWAVRGAFWSSRSGDWSMGAFGAGGSYRWFIEPTAPEEFYVGGGLDITLVTVKLGSEEATGVAFAPKAEAGYTWLFGSKKNFAISIGAEAYYLIGNIKVGDESWPFGGFKGALVGRIGYAW